MLQCMKQSRQLRSDERFLFDQEGGGRFAKASRCLIEIGACPRGDVGSLQRLRRQERVLAERRDN